MADLAFHHGSRVFATNATAPDRVRISFNAGNIDDGRIIVKGLVA